MTAIVISLLFGVGLTFAPIAHALGVHADPAKPWTVEELARASALSRSALAERFTALVIVEALEHPAQEPEHERVRVAGIGAEPHRRLHRGEFNAGETGGRQ